MEEVAVVKKRGRPSKGGGAPPTSGSPGPVDSTPTIPKKRGRPPKAKGGRGRPPKYVAPAATRNSDNEDLDQDDLGDANGELPMQPLKLKGRGRPRKPNVHLPENSGNDDDEDDGDSSGDEKPAVKQQKSPSSAKRRKLGRPRKHQPSDEEADYDDDDEPRPVGRPSTGAVNLNIVRTGRGPGRPKKSGGRRSSPNAGGDSNGDDAPTVPKKRGRPSLGNKPAVYVPSGRPRGRPKANASTLKVSDDDEEPRPEQHDDSDEDAEESGEESTALATTTTPKKRGRPPVASSKSSSGGKSRGRPKLHKSPSNQDDDADELDSAAEVDESNGNALKKRGRPLLSAISRGRPKSAKASDANGGDSLSGGDDDDNEDSSNGADGDDGGAGEDSDEPDSKQKNSSDSKSDRKELNSPENGDKIAARNEDSVECISDEPTWAGA